MSTEAEAQIDKGTDPHTPWLKTMLLALAASIAVSLVLLAFSWPAFTAEPKNLPVAVTGNEQQVTALEQQLPGGLVDAKPVADREAAIAKIKQREVYGAIITGDPASGAAPEILTASASSSVATQVLTQMAGKMEEGMQQQAFGKMMGAAKAGQLPDNAALPTVKVTEIVPFSKDDPRGTGLTVAGFPLVLGGMIGGAVIAFAVHGRRKSLTTLAIYGVLAGLFLTAILQFGFGALQGNFALNVFAMGLALVATASLISGLKELVGPPGVGIGALITMFIGNPISSVTQPKEFLPGSWGEIGQFFVPGASGTLIRNLSYFPEAHNGFYWTVLTVWLLVGLFCFALSNLRSAKA